MFLASQPAHYDTYQFVIAYGIIAIIGFAMLVWMRSCGVPLHKIIACAFLLFVCVPLSIFLMIKYSHEGKVALQSDQDSSPEVEEDEESDEDDDEEEETDWP